MPARRAEKKLSSKKLSALEKLKKIRAGEKVEEEEEVEEDDYEYIEEEEEDYEDPYISKKGSKNKTSTRKENLEVEKPKKHKGKLTKDKCSNLDESEEPQNKGLDIRKAFFNAAKSEKSKPKAEAQSADIDDDDFAMEIMKELNQVCSNQY